MVVCADCFYFCIDHHRWFHVILVVHYALSLLCRVEIGCTRADSGNQHSWFSFCNQPASTCHIVMHPVNEESSVSVPLSTSLPSCFSCCLIATVSLCSADSLQPARLLSLYFCIVGHFLLIFWLLCWARSSTMTVFKSLSHLKKQTQFTWGGLKVATLHVSWLGSVFTLQFLNHT